MITCCTGLPLSDFDSGSRVPILLFTDHPVHGNDEAIGERMHDSLCKVVRLRNRDGLGSGHANLGNEVEVQTR